MTRRIFLGLAIAAALFAPTALPPTEARADALSDRIGQIPAEVEEVRVVGEWRQDDRAGSYRLVVARTGSRDLRARFFIQWIAYVPGGAEIQASQEIAEVYELGADVKETTVELAGDRLVVSFELTGKAEVEGTYEAIVRGPGDYRFQKAGN